MSPTEWEWSHKQRYLFVIKSDVCEEFLTKQGNVYAKLKKQD